MSPDWQYRPARDQGLAPGARLRSPQRETGLGGSLVQAGWRRLVGAYLGGMHRFAVAGRENLPAAPPFMMVANHASHLDALALAAALPAGLARRAFALAAGDTFFERDTTAAFAAYAINALPVWRGRTSMADLDALRARLIEDRLVMILFPEGTRTRTGAMGRFKPGIGALCAGTDVPVVPCFLEGAFAAWPPSRRLPGRGRLRLSIGAPLHFAGHGHGEGHDRAAHVAVAAACEAAVRALASRPG